MIVYAAVYPSLGARAVVRRLDASESQLIPASANAAHLRFSPDGKFLYASLNGSTMQRHALGSGAWVPANLEITSFMTFAPDGLLWWGSVLSFGSYRRGADGRDSLVFPRSTISQVLPDGRHAVALGITTGSNSGDLQWLDLRTGAVQTVFEGPVVDVRYTMGYLVYVRPDGVMVAVPFDARAGRLTGPHTEIASDVSVSGVGFAQFAVSDNGTVAFIPGFNSKLVRVNRTGDLRMILEEHRRYHSPRIAPDGRRISFDDVTPEGRDVWVYTEGTRGISRATFQRDGHDAVWTLDGRGLYYLAGSRGKLDIFRTLLGSTTPAQAESMRVELSYTGTPLRGAGESFLTTTPGAGRGLDVVRLSGGGGKVDTVLATPSDESYVVPSPDGRWFAYISDHSGRPELYLRGLSGGDIQLQISLDGASEPVWSRDGRELYYRRATPTGAELVAAKLQLGAEPAVLSRTRLFDVTSFDTSAPHANYDVAPDGSWFVFAQRSSSDYIVLLQNVPELARRAARDAGTVQ
jgi:Tol biopolymer transport system component